MPLPWKPVQRLVNTDIVLAFDQFLGISEALHTDLDTAIMIAGTDWDESTSTPKQLDEALLPLEVSRQGPGPLISEVEASGGGGGVEPEFEQAAEQDDEKRVRDTSSDKTD
ncbi:hypothetical protein FOTG_12501 [Fusarium oxysporum f. sp. vasinfectum 25433]|uniref:Uncharacterized protein n=1 Tax=Fusarium oxysporum f. sp. vasinfectum 25433 TaxID=1089449 RepID=X0MFW2_FUSOX|nr:hypothetical protein FOTG_12501 [Fusarium oxysporum f. sp. vasinfectum 25433]